MSDGDWWESWLMLGLLLFLKKYMHFNLLCCKKSEIEQKSEVHLEKTCEIAVEQSFNEKWNRAVISVWGHQTSIISLLGSNITIRCAFFFSSWNWGDICFFCCLNGDVSERVSSDLVRTLVRCFWDVWKWKKSQRWHANPQDDLLPPLPHRHSAKIHKLRKLTDGAPGHFVSYLNL